MIGIIKTYIIASIVFFPSIANHSAEANTLDTLFIKHAVSEGVEPRLLKAICKVESGLRPSARNLMDGGRASYGICQVQLRTAKHMGFTGTPGDLMTADLNIKYASKYFSFQLERYKNNWKRALVAYNKGHYTSGDNEINEYVIKVMVAYKETNIQEF